VDPSRGFAAGVYGNWVYLFGGSGTPNLLQLVQRFPFGFGSASSATGNNLAEPVTAPAFAAAGDFVYLFGGSNTTGILDHVEYAGVH
jgi:hypothetical protein